ncbi:glycoside hydrolase family 32 protein [Clavibacter sepedonicus]|uniref:Levanase n=1 Tax=Clavibacter sepedonicus TaxID=31964 RepID=B0RFJ4_CLASE|nr:MULTISPECIES: glycoside hydrolase family 32 protein [Clavibacter]OQJ49402.1 levanase [Clavibacter sepedonicus]UUK64739.1 glycoside hydrolase family 32 protein [Clavibacter sepedonicus]CAQ01054.1 putative levanase [Clavibacter sepedonicus]
MESARPPLAPRTAHPRGRMAALAAAAALVCALAVPASSATAEPTVPADGFADGFAADADRYRAQYHFTVPDHWKNDPQRPVVIDGVTHYYYLYNADYDQEVGTSWRLATTTDGVAWADQGIAAEKKTNPNFDLWSGSAVVDPEGTAGFGRGAVVMLVTQMDHPTPQQIVDASGPQAQFLWYSTDGGRTFTPSGEEAVLPNPGVRDFRDPKVVWDDERGSWVMLIAEGATLSFSTSPDLRSWTRVSTFAADGLGVLECPDLFRITADDGTSKWVLGASANGYATGEPNTYAYWTGSFDGRAFVPDPGTGHRWLDQGFDWYGAVTWADPTAQHEERRLAVGWMNNWSYPKAGPTWESDGFTGTDSITREIRLARADGGYRLLSQPIAALAGHATSVRELGPVRVDGSVVLPYAGTAYQLETEIAWDRLDNVGLQLRRSADGSRHADVGVFRDTLYANRGGTGNPDPTGNKLESRSPFDASAKEVKLRILVDRTTVEVFVDYGEVVHSSQVFAEPADAGIALFTQGGAATFSNLRITEFADLAQRPAHVLADFEGTTAGVGWTGTGDLVGLAPNGSPLVGRVGRQALDTYVPGRGDAATGTLTSPPFTIDRDAIHLLIAGGDHGLGAEPATSVNLLVDGEPVRTATGDDSAKLRPVAWDVSDLAGRTARIQVLDDATGAWGHLMVDQVMLAD